jgi:PLP dependent protein
MSDAIEIKTEAYWQALIARRWVTLQAQVASLSQGRPITIVAVSKYASLVQIRAAYAVGIRHFGENKVQDALAKQAALPPQWQQPNSPDAMVWHLIGPLQRNKVGKAVGRFHLLHSVDSLALAHKVSAIATERGILQPVLMQANITQEASKAGFSPPALVVASDELASLPGLQWEGLMTIARADDPPQALQTTFRGLNQLRHELSLQIKKPLLALSMGMSDDYTQAIVEGATIVRIGRALFSEDPDD